MSEREQRARPAAERQALPPLRLLAGREARRPLADAQVASHRARAAEGWERRFVAEGARAEEMMQSYRDLGFEVVADPVTAEDLPAGCESCRLLEGVGFCTIYTRRPPQDHET